MFKHLLISFLTLFFLQSNLNAQVEVPEKVYYSDIDERIREFQLILTNYARKNNLKKISDKNSLFKVVYDTINRTIVGTYFDNYEFIASNDSLIKLKEFKKPIFLMVSTINEEFCSECTIQISYLNSIAQKFKNDIHFMLLLKNFKQSSQKILASINKNIIVIPETSGKDITSNFSEFNYHLEIPKIFLINRSKKIINIKSSIFTEGIYPGKNNSQIYISEQEAKKKNREKIEKLLISLIKE